MLKIELWETLLLNNGAAFYRDIREMGVSLGIIPKTLGASASLRCQLVDGLVVKARVVPELNKKYGLQKSALLFYFSPQAKERLRRFKANSFYEVDHLMNKAKRICKTLYEKGRRPYPHPIPREKIWIFGRPTKEDIISIFGKELI